MTFQIHGWRFFLLVTLMGIICFSQKAQAERLTLVDQDLYQFANSLYESEEYYRAVSEYQRLLYFFPESPMVPEARLRIGRSFMAGGAYGQAMEYWEKELVRSPADTSDLDSVKTLYGITLLDIDAAKPYRLRLQNINRAIDIFSSVEGNEPEHRWVRDFAADWRNTPPPERKSPWLAGSLSSVVPGAGSFYIDRKREGLYAFFFTCLFSLATVESFHSEQLELGYIFGFFSLAFYGGNIYTAVNSAHKYNDLQGANQLNQTRKKHGIWFIPTTENQPGRF